MKNSKGETLPQPYLDLARMRREQQNGEGDQIAYETCIHWGRTPEGGIWWMQVYECESPDIPAASLAELDAWQRDKEFEIRAEPADDRIAALQLKCERMQNDYDHLLEERNRYRSQCHKYEMEKAEPATDWKAKYEELKTAADKIFAIVPIDRLRDIANEMRNEYAEFDIDPTRNYVAECAMAAMQGYLSNPSESDTSARWILQMLGLPENTKYDWLVHHPQFIAKLSFDYAEAMAAEGRKRGHIK